MATKTSLRYPQDYKPAHKLDSVTAENYKVPKGWERSFVVKQEQLHTDNDGVRKSVPTIQTYPAETWERDRNNLLRMKHTLVLLYDPTEYLVKAEAAKAAASEPVDTAALVAKEVAKALGGKTPEQIAAEAVEKYKQELAAAAGGNGTEGGAPAEEKPKRTRGGNAAAAGTEETGK